MVCSQVADGLESHALPGKSEAVKRADVAVDERVVLQEDERLVSKQNVLLLLLAVEDGVDPVAVSHIHAINEVRLDDARIELSGLGNPDLRLEAILVDQLRAGRVNQLGCDRGHRWCKLGMELIKLVIVEELIRLLEVSFVGAEGLQLRLLEFSFGQLENGFFFRITLD